MPADATGCSPIGPAVPEGGWAPARAGVGPGYPPTGASGVRALNDLLPTLAGAGRGDTANYVDSYAEWIRRLAR